MKIVCLLIISVVLMSFVPESEGWGLVRKIARTVKKTVDKAVGTVKDKVVDPVKKTVDKAVETAKDKVVDPAKNVVKKAGEAVAGVVKKADEVKEKAVDAVKKATG